MIVEKYKKTTNGPMYYSLYFTFGKAHVNITDIRADSKDSALEKAVDVLKKAEEEIYEES